MYEINGVNEEIHVSAFSVHAGSKTTFKLLVFYRKGYFLSHCVTISQIRYIRISDFGGSREQFAGRGL